MITEILSAIWAMFTNNGMYSSWEAIIVLVVSFALTVAFINHNTKMASREKTANIIRDLGYDGYLRHKETMKKLGIDIE